MIRTVIAGAIMLATLPALTDTGTWTERDICRAAVKTYFFLSGPPTDAANQAEYFGFVSTAGNVYACRLSGGRAVFRWLTKGGEPMRSELARSIHDRSIVSSDFARAGAFVRPLHGAGI